jgi:hypothetical protein
MIGTDLSFRLGGSGPGCVFRYEDSYICHPLAPLLLLVEFEPHETTHNIARGQTDRFFKPNYRRLERERKEQVVPSSGLTQSLGTI